jgi:hypothetical protein
VASLRKAYVSRMKKRGVAEKRTREASLQMEKRA